MAESIGSSHSISQSAASNEEPNSDERDINDIFDDIVLSEERVADEEYQKGFDESAAEGNLEGYHLGYHRGAELGAELGYYEGVLRTYSSTSPATEKAERVIATCLELIERFPRTNDEQSDILQLADNIRAQFRKACALLKINGRFPEADQLNF